MAACACGKYATTVRVWSLYDVVLGHPYSNNAGRVNEINEAKVYWCGAKGCAPTKPPKEEP